MPTDCGRRLIAASPGTVFIAVSIAALVLGLVLPRPGITQAPVPAPIHWSAEQARDAGVVTIVVAKTSDAGGSEIVLPGTVVVPPKAMTVVSSPLPAVVQELFVSVGDEVAAGDRIARIASQEILEWQRALRQAEAQEALASRRLARDEQLYAEGLISASRLQDTRSEQRITRLAADERRRALRLAGAGSTSRDFDPALTLTATGAGTVLDVQAAPGQRIESGTAIVRLARIGALAVEIQASGELAARLRQGDRVMIDGCTTAARIASIQPQVNADNQTVRIRADLDGAQRCLRVNQYVRVRVASGAGSDPNRIEVPGAAIVRHQGQAWIFLRTADGFMPRVVALGNAGGDRVSVLSGVAPGDEIAIAGIAALKGAWLGLGADSR